MGQLLVVELCNNLRQPELFSGLTTLDIRGMVHPRGITQSVRPENRCCTLRDFNRYSIGRGAEMERVIRDAY